MKIKLFLAVLGSGITAAFHRNNSHTVALGNEAPAPDQSKEQKQQPETPEAYLAKENAMLKEKVAKLEASQPKNAKAIKAKMEAGLSREQAEAAVANQKAFTEKFEDTYLEPEPTK